MSDLVSVRTTQVDHRKSLFMAILVTAVGAGLVFILSRAFLIDQDFVGSIYENGVPRALAGLFLLFFPYIHQRLAGRRRTSFSQLPDEAVPFDRYTLAWYMVLTYGVLIAFALAGISLLLVWLIGLVTPFFITRLITPLAWIILLVTFYYLSFWAGTRNTHRPSLIAIGIVVGYTILELVVSSIFDIDSPLRSRLGLIVFLILSVIIALIGVRVGKRRRLSNYIHFLLDALPPQDRQTVVDGLYKDVNQRRKHE